MAFAHTNDLISALREVGLVDDVAAIRAAAETERACHLAVPSIMVADELFGGETEALDTHSSQHIAYLAAQSALWDAQDAAEAALRARGGGVASVADHDAVC